MSSVLFSAPDTWPIAGEYDVVVVGAGPGGIGAAIAAARVGARTLLIEKGSYPGGMATAGLIPNIMGMAYDGQQITYGIAEEICRALGKCGYGYLRASHRLPETHPIHDQPIITDVIASVHGIQLVTFRLLQETGVDVLFHTRLIGAVTNENRITDIAIDRVEGPALIRGKTFVDATGDAQLIWRAGGDTRTASDDERMTKTLLMDLGGITAFDPEAVRLAFMEQVEAGTIPVSIQDKFMGYAAFEPGIVHMNFTADVGDALCSAELTRMDHALREQIEAGIAWFRKYIPGFETCFLARSPQTVGIRAGRGAVGIETITQNDIDENPPVPEPVGLGLRYYGDHGIKGFSSTWQKVAGGPREIPWKTLLSANFKNTAMAGRCISCEPKMLTCIRYIAQCLTTGQAAGVTAGLASTRNTSLLDVGYSPVREELQKQNVKLTG